MKFQCTELTNLDKLDRARKNTTAIRITDSNLLNLPGHSFARFGATLVTLDLHDSGIETIDSQAFIGLTKLETLILWGNKLKWVPGDWFLSTPKLRTLDLSFNSIQLIDYPVFQRLQQLENFYFDYNQLKFIDYNMFAYLRNLKTVKFGKNPLGWPYRARLTWQLENQRVQFTEEWESWGWMNVAIKECIETGQGELPKDTVLDCVTGNLLDFVHQMSGDKATQQIAGCYEETRRLVLCTRTKNTTYNSDNETARRILQDYVTVLSSMSRSLGPFSSGSHS